MKVAIIGAGASGLMLAGLLKKQGHDVFVYEKNDRAGKKLAITGKGRCNITNLCDVEDFLKNVVRGEKFLKSALYSFDSQDCVDFFENLGLKTKVERGQRVFPESDKASDIVKILENKHCKDVKFSFSNEVLKIDKNGENNFVVFSRKGENIFDRVVIATGGVSYKGTGSTGDGFRFAKSFGHRVVETRPALCPILIEDKFVSALQGVSLKNVSLNVFVGKKKMSFFGEMLFTDKGISGPIVLTASSYINRFPKSDVRLSLDFKPALSDAQLDARLLRDFENNKNKELKSIMRGLLPKTVAEMFPKICGLDDNKKIHDITKKEREALLFALKNFKLTYGGLYDINAGIITSGGVDISQVDPKTFESKLVDGLYFTGEVLDLDALTGGFNLQIAWSSAFCLAKNFNL